MRAPLLDRARRAVLTLAVVLLAAGAVPFIGATPSAVAAEGTAPGTPQQWRAVVRPSRGVDDTPIEVRTTGGCPPPATNILGRAFGAGFPRDGVNVIGNTDAGVSAKGPFTTVLFRTLRDVMDEQARPVPLRGDYRIVVTCRRPDLDRSYGDYVVAVRFTSPHAWRAAPPLSDADGYRPPGGAGTSGAGRSPSSSVAPQAAGVAGASATSNGSAGAGASAGNTAGNKAGDPAANADARSLLSAPDRPETTSRRPWGLGLAALGLVIALLSLVVLRRRGA